MAILHNIEAKSFSYVHTEDTKKFIFNLSHLIYFLLFPNIRHQKKLFNFKINISLCIHFLHYWFWMCIYLLKSKYCPSLMPSTHSESHISWEIFLGFYGVIWQVFAIIFFLSLVALASGHFSYQKDSHSKCLVSEGKENSTLKMITIALCKMRSWYWWTEQVFFEDCLRPEHFLCLSSTEESIVCMKG